MLIAIALLAAPLATAEPFDFSRGYVVWVSEYRGQCRYFMTDVGESAKQFTATLRENYPMTSGIEILTDSDTPERCAVRGAKAARNAGLSHVRIRVGTEKDRVRGIP